MAESKDTSAVTVRIGGEEKPKDLELALDGETKD